VASLNSRLKSNEEEPDGPKVYKPSMQALFGAKVVVSAGPTSALYSVASGGGLEGARLSSTPTYLTSHNVLIEWVQKYNSPTKSSTHGLLWSMFVFTYIYIYI
jgi:hypothetical protein